MSPDPTLAIAEYVHDTSYADLPQQAIANAKVGILDTIGVMFAGSQHQVGRLITDYVRDSGAIGASTVIGQQLRTSPELAALANGVMAHALDYDDHGHASTQSLPAALALAEVQDGTGRDVLVAYIVGKEVCLHLSKPFDRGGWEGNGPKGHGWHSVGVIGSIGATAASAKMLGLIPQTICTALGVAASLGGGLFANRGTMTKPLHAGNAARNGVLASTLASKGFTADTTILTSPGGFTEAFHLPQEYDIHKAVENLRDHFHIVKEGVGIKPYPSCTPTHRYIETMKFLRSKYQIAPESVHSIACTPSKSLRCLYPNTDLECRFSAAFSLVATLIDGEVNLHNCTENFLSRSDVQALLAKTTYIDNLESGGFVRIRTMSGTVYEQPLLPSRDLSSYEQIRGKFYDCTVPVIGEARAQQLETLIADLDKLQSVNTLAALLQPK
ncbi:MmgE/PrpD family protein [Thermodesulfobacteriota bacterium]